MPIQNLFPRDMMSDWNWKLIYRDETYQIPVKEVEEAEFFVGGTPGKYQAHSYIVNWDPAIHDMRYRSRTISDEEANNLERWDTCWNPHYFIQRIRELWNLTPNKWTREDMWAWYRANGIYNDEKKKSINTKPFLPCHFVEYGPEDYALVLDDENFTHEKIFEEAGLISNGYCWSGLIDGIIKTEKPELIEELKFSPEAGSLLIGSGNLDALKEISTLIKKMIRSEKYVKDCISKIGAKNID